jgi:hypothetical protein
MLFDHLWHFFVSFSWIYGTEEKINGTPFGGKLGQYSGAGSYQVSMTWYFVTKIVLTYCEKKLF